MREEPLTSRCQDRPVASGRMFIAEVGGARSTPCIIVLEVTLLSPVALGPVLFPELGDAVANLCTVLPQSAGDHLTLTLLSWKK